jgi:hypothetical protein
VVLNALISAVRREFSLREFTAIIGAQHAQLAATLHLLSSLRTPDSVRSLSLAAEDHHPHVAGEVVDKQQEVTSSSQCGWCHRATQVPVHELEPLLGFEAHLLGKEEPPLLHQHADIAELLHVVEAWQASHHLLGTEPLQGLEVKVPEALVPLPRLVIPTSSEAEGLCHLHIKEVESVCTSGYLGKKAMMAIPNPQDSILDPHARTVLIQLSQADDRVPQCGDVVDSNEQPVLTRLGGEDDGADALDLHAGGVPKLNGASDAGVKLGEELPLTGHVMGGAGIKAPPVSLVVIGCIAEKGVCLGLSRWRRSAAADAAGGSSMLACAKSRAGYSSSTCAMWAWPHRGCRGGGLPLPPITLAGLPLFPSEMELPANGDRPRKRLWLIAIDDLEETYRLLDRLCGEIQQRLDRASDLLVLLGDAAEELLNNYLFIVGVIAILHHLLQQSVEAESKVINVLTWLEGHILPLLAKCLQCGLAGAVAADACCSDGIPDLLGSPLLGKQELHLGRDCSNEGIKRPSILVVVDVAVPNCLPHVPHLEPYPHHHSPLDIVGLGEGRPPTARANVPDNSLDPVVTMAPVWGGRAALPVKAAISVDPAAVAGSAAAACVPTRIAAGASTPVWAAATAPVGVRGCPLRRALSRCFPLQFEFHVGAAIGRGRADGTTAA